MAMVKCRECQQDVSDSARTCPNCGINEPAGACEITLRRVGLNAALATIEVYLDSQHIGMLKRGNELVKAVTPGRHILRGSVARAKDAEQAVQVSRGDSLDIEVSLSKMTGAVKFTIKNR